MEAPQRLSSECGKQEIPGLVGTVGDAEDKGGNGPPTKRKRQLLSSLSRRWHSNNHICMWQVLRRLKLALQVSALACRDALYNSFTQTQAGSRVECRRSWRKN